MIVKDHEINHVELAETPDEILALRILLQLGNVVVNQAHGVFPVSGCVHLPRLGHLPADPRLVEDVGLVTVKRFQEDNIRELHLAEIAKAPGWCPVHVQDLGLCLDTVQDILDELGEGGAGCGGGGFLLDPVSAHSRRGVVGSEFANDLIAHFGVVGSREGTCRSRNSFKKTRIESIPMHLRRSCFTYSLYL